MKKILLYSISLLFLMSDVLYSDTYEGYIRQTDVSFCMSDCSQFFIENESSQFLSNVSFNGVNPLLYINRYVEIQGEVIWCVECGAIEINHIEISSNCNYPTSCFVDPCSVALPCELNTPVNCVSNYCGGCYADFYDLEENLVDCYIAQDPLECDDLSGLFFGLCDMFMGYAVVNGTCEGISGCGWEVDGIDYSNAFFENIDECDESCFNVSSCEDIENNYEDLFSNEFTSCDFNNDCVSIWGDCDVGLGVCHYSINPDLFNENSVDTLVNLWNENDCMQWVCDCSSLPNSICDNGTCQTAYCYDENPTGCFVAGCPDGYQCLDDSNSCIPSQCFCDEFYGDWFCTEDCGGGTCVPLLNGDSNYDGMLNVSDIIIIVNMILNIIPYDFIADMNNDGSIDIIDIVSIISVILNN